MKDPKCVPCTITTAPLRGEELKKRHQELGGNWKLVEEKHLEKEYRFKNFAEALSFTHRLGHLAEEMGHHPDIHLSWGKVKVIFWTHKIGGLSAADFTMAAKSDILFQT